MFPEAPGSAPAEKSLSATRDGIFGKWFISAGVAALAGNMPVAMFALKQSGMPQRPTPAFPWRSICFALRRKPSQSVARRAFNDFAASQRAIRVSTSSRQEYSFRLMRSRVCANEVMATIFLSWGFQTHFRQNKYTKLGPKLRDYWWEFSNYGV
ncbi:hypothetical protein GGQ73_003376 [Rhizobium skierniewicense]|uniref:Uncharacterized protein n=1 Tax=Rhizobium skierniewicense TaxID=984260 RepID=A0A7W6CAC5_9HYPH|nr:hypothetical protein [Rhizobium skierniewicense]